eukprot:5780297-Pleurochrysis_carterae.AAC.2
MLAALSPPRAAFLLFQWDKTAQARAMHTARMGRVRGRFTERVCGCPAHEHARRVTYRSSGRATYLGRLRLHRGGSP